MWHCGNLYLNVYAIQQWAGNLAAVTRNLIRRAATFAVIVAEVAQGHGRVAFLPFVRVSLKSLRKKPFDFEPKTLGEQIKKKRLELGLSQKEVGKMLGVTSFTVLNWEKGKTEPLPQFVPMIILFLGYGPVRPD